MNVTLKTIWLATHRVFSARLVPVGCSLTLREMMEGWKDCGLRKTDLATALQSLEREGYVRIETTPAGRVIRLLNEEFGLLRPGDAADQEAARTLVRIRELRRRPMGHMTALAGGAKTGRRKSDRSQGAASTAAISPPQPARSAAVSKASSSATASPGPIPARSPSGFRQPTAPG